MLCTQLVNKTIHLLQLLCEHAGACVAYNFMLFNTGNVELRGLQVVVPVLSGNSSDGSITCVDPTTGDSWPAASDLAANSSLSCGGSFSFSQDAIEAGDLSPEVSAAAANLAAPVSVALPVITVPSLPELLVTVDTSGCTLPQLAGAFASSCQQLIQLHHQLPATCDTCMQHAVPSR
jgi:hypothetical protein